MKLNDTFFGSWKIDKRIGSGSYGSVYRLKKNDFGEDYYSAMKVIPVSSEDRENCLDEFVREFSIMSKLKGNSNIVSYEDHQIISRDDGGCDIVIRMELLKPLLKHEKEKSFENRDILKLGIDMCRALELCEKNNIIHRDIKPENIFVSANGDFKLGDFGIARILEKTCGCLSKKGTFAYMAPEVYKGEKYDMRADIYSLGIVLYRFLNYGFTPFLSENCCCASDRENAVARRIKGETVPEIPGVDKSLMNIILKACSYKPHERYKNAGEMAKDLEKLLAEENAAGAKRKKPPKTLEELGSDKRFLTVIKVLIYCAAVLAAILLILLIV